MRATINAPGFDFADTLRKHWAKFGTGTYPLVFRDDNGNTYEATEIITENKTTVVQLRTVQEGHES
ncbi:hypothetical protein HOT82_gp111 [Gordonia phage Ronaldo]|uniref:Uncharacterized protein n=4 Tax=Ronaldovirus TaxID=2733205 RepID=A0A6B9L8B7_9CAUD|nr:hypothetical protein HOT81_gp109 [Gordonia phage Fryberger]YP_009807807.1 hypothetical protein HOT82_gp111 [Gordonia phage Ronaldo]QDH48450.1 hypothetical protein SEA_ZIKO_112 [Gordonia phage Ziko]QHB38227.1 hypothetical protein SEA_VOLT_113 [Gordonia phage Volt]QTF81897.1 hypothetical protein SEA_GUEY18_114 [Gordonia phage Guey18]AXN53525.1 hypothetical protein SEA_FRYBERGER_109 [Gordonia phage Fryberger]AXN53673.1 hypothetical protein SEA_RONALDO_111 [Gordonia phage Ronaldo]